MLILKRVMLVGTCLIQRITSSSWLGLGRWSSLCHQISFLFYWKDCSSVLLVDLSGLGLLSFSSALTLVMIFSACWPCKTNCFQVWHSTTPIWARSVVCSYDDVSTSVVCVMPLGHCSAMLQNLLTNILIDSPFFCFVTRRVGSEISVSS